MIPLYLSSVGQVNDAVQARTEVSSLPDENSQGACYAVLHEPQGQFLADFAVLFVNAWGQEYVRSHRGMRTLALNLQRQGIASLRFDYRGTGDSSGSAEAFTVESAQQDIHTALGYLTEASGVSEVIVFSLRLGSLLALSTLADDHRVRRFLCWDPLLTGTQFIQQVQAKAILLNQAYWYNGYAIDSAALQAFAALTISPTLHTPIDLYALTADDAVTNWLTTRTQASWSIRQFLVPTSRSEQAEWGSADALGSFINPHEIVRLVTEQLSQESTL